MFAAVPKELIEFVLKGSRFIVAGHKEPDGDCVGSQLALCSALRRLGKEAIACSAGPFKRTEIKPYEARFCKTPSEEEKAGARVIIVDCSTAERSGDLSPCLEGLPTAVIDHHATGDHAPSSPNAPVFLDPLSPSTTALIFVLIEALGLSLSKEEADLLFFGLCTDTGFFRHVDSGGADIFDAAARMIRSGASPKAAFLAINGGKGLNSRILMGHILSRSELFFEGRLVVSFENYEDTQRFGLEGRDSDSLYQLLQSVAGVEAIVIIRQETPENCTVGFRSLDKIDIGAIAAGFGGGGHKNAAGCSVMGTIADLKPKIIEAFSKIFH
jgi:phosphoesterase RecJ-like protein